MTTYGGRIIREQGASVLTVASGGSVNFAAGGALATSGGLNLSGGITFGQASQTQVAGGAFLFATGASINVNLTASDRGTFNITDGTRSPTIGVGRNLPTHTASAGSIYLRSDGSMSALYWNDSDGNTGGSVWKTAASASTGAPQ